MSTRSGQPRKRGGRVVDKATPERVMDVFSQVGVS